MSKLIDELKAEHKELSSILLELQQVGLPTETRLNLLIKSKNLFLIHLSKEDTQLYPPLNERAISDLSLKITLDTFAKEMDEITEFVFDFYEKYTNSHNFDKLGFIKDMSKFTIAIKNRIMKEEIAIYTSYEKLNLD